MLWSLISKISVEARLALALVDGSVHRLGGNQGILFKRLASPSSSG